MPSFSANEIRTFFKNSSSISKNVLLGSSLNGENTVPTYIFYLISAILMSEILPLRARSFGCGLVGLLDNLSCMLSAKMVPTIELYMGLHGMFYMYSCVSIFVAIVCFFIIPETKDLTLEEIECMYTSSNQKKSSQEL